MTQWQKIGCLFFLLSYSACSSAYLDPGTGSSILQGILGAIAALALTAKLWWHRLLILLGLRKRKQRNAYEDHKNDDQKPDEPKQ